MEILTSEFLKEELMILDFSPNRSIYRILKNNASIHYVGSDISGDFLSDFHYDITHIDAESDKFDVIICYHVLEHVENDDRAMKELYRVLKKGGSCIIQTPFKEGNIYEDPSINTEIDRLRHFGQKDHVRIYSVSGLKERLVACGFQVTTKQFHEPEENKFGFKTNEEVLIGTK
jgi:SAM-dependent methyltransferase